ncbi:MAG: hypothetical protein ACO3ND_10610 [Opitutales bacterium]
MSSLEEIANEAGSWPFRKYAAGYLHIEALDGAIEPFTLNEAQLIVDDEIERQRRAGRPIRVLILKGRQQGMSTYCQMRLARHAMTRPGARCITVGHALGAVHELYQKFDRAHREMLEPLKPAIEERERGRRIRFTDPMRSMYRADSAHEPEKVGRGLTAQYAHLTEIPQWPKADETMQAILAVIPDEPDTEVLVESTAKGSSGWFYEQFVAGMRALDRGEEPDFVPVFVPWFKTARYRRKYRQGEGRLTKAERAFKAEHDLDTEQVLWYRDMRRRFGDRVTEEYPSTWREAFLSSGLPFFQSHARDVIRDFIRGQGGALYKGHYRTYKVGSKTKTKFDKSGESVTRIYATPADHRYSVGVDFASGRSKDSSAIIVTDVDARAIVATHKSKFKPDDVLAEAVSLGRHYNTALMIPERSGIGQALVDRLVREYKYPNVYREVDPAAVKYHKAARWGWATSARNRMWLLEEFALLVHNNELAVPCPLLLEEMDAFIYSKEAGSRAEADAGHHDDMVMAAAMSALGFTAIGPRTTTRRRAKRSVSVSSKTGY